MLMITVMLEMNKVRPAVMMTMEINIITTTGRLNKVTAMLMLLW